jgi:hypothetical protein
MFFSPRQLVSSLQLYSNYMKAIWQKNSNLETAGFEFYPSSKLVQEWRATFLSPLLILHETEIDLCEVMKTAYHIKNRCII